MTFASPNIAKELLPTDVPADPARDLATLVVGSEQSAFFLRSPVGTTVAMSRLCPNIAQSFTGEKVDFYQQKID
jgi:hypothetical protein